MADDGRGPSPARRAVDGRDRSAIRADASARAPYYTGDDWDPEAGGAGTALLDLFADLAAGVVDRLDQAPDRHRAAFVDALGFDRLPPQPGRLPLAVQISDGAGSNVHLPAGTRALAPATETRPELTFELDEGFEATPAALDRLVSVDPRLDHVATHEDALGGSGPATLFGGPNDQRHVLYLGHADLLTLGTETTVEVRLDTTADANTLAALEWEYFGETPEADADEDEGWRELDLIGVGSTPVGPGLDLDAVRGILDDHGFELATDDPTAVERWLVSTLLARGDPDPTPPHVDPVRRPAVVDLYEALDGYVREVYGDHPPPVSTTFDEVILRFAIEEPFVETERFGVESRWLRAGLPSDASPMLAAELRAVEVRDVELAAGRLREPTDGDPAPNGEFSPDDLLANDVPLEVPDGGEPIRPFGTFPRVQDALYVGSEEAFTKGDQTVTLSISSVTDHEWTTDPPQVSEPPLVSWEYWNGSAWEFIDIEEIDVQGIDVEDLPKERSVAVLSYSGALSFSVPSDLEPTSVSGHEGHWIRARLVGRGYGAIEIEDSNGDLKQNLDKIKQPELESISIAYESADGGDSSGLITGAPQHRFAENNLSQTAVPAGSRFRPFEPLPDDDQALYLGFDGPIEGGPLQVFAQLADVEYPPGFRPRLRWEVYTDEGWQRVTVRDDTEGLTESGVVRFSPPTTTIAHARFGDTRHWLRARVTADRFVGAPYRRRAETDDGDDGTGSCGDHLPTTPPGAEAAMALPEAGLVGHNTGLAANLRSVTDEILGSSDGTADQQFAVASPPVRDATLWVDELPSRSAGERAALAEDPDVTVERVGDEADPTAFWVQWTPVEDFLESGRTDRHYTLDSVTGVVTFGDGTAGAIPPRGRDSIRISYETGGGVEGNVPAGAVDELEGSLAFIEGATNPLSSDGGADAETTAAVLERAPRELRDRNRAVAPADYERLAMASARKLARARCLPGLSPIGRYRPGWVTVLIVPRSRSRKPVPSASLRAQVTAGLGRHAPASVLGELGDERLVVRGPSYVEATVEATVVAGAVESLSALEAAAADALSAYLHPLVGGDDGSGWPFGDLPCVSDCFGVLEGVEGVDHVEDLALHFETATGVTRTIGPGQDPPSVDPDVLSHSGRHDLDVVGGT